MNRVAKRGFALACLGTLAWALVDPVAVFAGHRYHSHGSHGSSGGSHGSSGGSHGSSGGSYGSHGSSGGSYGSHGSSGGSYGSHGSSGGSHGSTVSHSRSESPGYYASESVQWARMVLTVPGDAKVFFQNQLTTSTGTVRQYKSPPLESGKMFVYTIRVEVERDGQLVSKTSEPRIGAGDRVELTFEDDQQGELVASVRHTRRR